MAEPLAFTTRDYSDEPVELVEEIRPVGDEGHIVRDGECMSSIAHEHGFFWETLWKLPENAKLRKERKDPNALLAGDRVFVPAVRVQDERCVTTARHTFRLKTTPVKLRVRLTYDLDEPRANLRYTLQVGTTPERQGTTDANGIVDEWVPAGAKEAVLTLFAEGRPPERMVLGIGALGPEESHEGIAHRLINLGFMESGDHIEEAIASFQSYHKLPVTGRPDDAFLDKLFEEYAREAVPPPPDAPPPEEAPPPPEPPPSQRA